jgi:oxygen-independent coproporphyrinogen-3 oxidase
VVELDVIEQDAGTEVGNYFVANYPPFSVWTREHVPAALAVLDRPVGDQASPSPLGLYLHIPFCRTRCKFCYYRVYTDKSSRDVRTYLDNLTREVALYAQRAGVRGRNLEFVYFGGGTPSFLSRDQLLRLVEGIQQHFSWDAAREITFECEPGTLQKSKLEAIRAIGTTRLSLGIEHLDDAVLELNGRAHHSRECYRALDWAREVGFDQINIDMIAGMAGDTEDKWRATVESAVNLDADSVTIYQMELPHNSTFARQRREGGDESLFPSSTAKRAWLDYAFRRFEEAGYRVSSAYTLAKANVKAEFVYRDALWQGADMIGTGVASFSHFQGVHFQNFDRWEDYVESLSVRGELPLARALPITPEQAMTRELVLQLKRGRLDARYFRERFGVEVTRRFAEPFADLQRHQYLTVDGDSITLSRVGLLRVDGLLPLFFEPRFRNVRYT